MLEVLASPLAFVGAIAGLLLALFLHWVAPTLDFQAGAWLIGVGWTAGLGWELLSNNREA